jgi:hypothetical protein
MRHPNSEVPPVPADHEPAPLRLRNLINGFQVSDAIAAAAQLDVASCLKEGPRRADAIAVQLRVHPATLYRLLRALASVGVFEEADDGSFALNEMGRLLLPDAPQSLRGWSLLTSRSYFREAWGHMRESVEAGRNAFQSLHEGESVWEWRAQRPHESAIFDSAMAGLSGGRAAAVVNGFPWGQFGTIADIGGGNGRLLGEILVRYPDTRGVLFDQPHVVEGSEPMLERLNVRDRCTIAGGSFFEAVPAGADVYMLSYVLHDWDDADCLGILSTVRAAMRTSARLVIVEQVVGPPNEEPTSKFSDLNMLVMLGGRERSEAEWQSLVKEGGFQTATLHRTGSPSWLIETVPA